MKGLNLAATWYKEESENLIILIQKFTSVAESNTPAYWVPRHPAK
jgi:hypothetical protein